MWYNSNLLTNSKTHSSSLKANRFFTSQEISNTLYNTNGITVFKTSRHIIPVLKQINPIYLSQLHLNKAFLSRFMSSKWPLLQSSPPIMCMNFKSVSHAYPWSLFYIFWIKFLSLPYRNLSAFNSV